MKYFHATSIRCSTEDNVLTIGIADDEFDPIDFIILSRLDQDLGLLINDTDEEFNNVIEKVRLHFNELTLTIRSYAHEKVDYSRINIELQLEDESELRFALKQMFKDTDVQLMM